LAEFNNDRAAFHLCARRHPDTPGSLRAPRAVASGKAPLSDVASREECAQHGDAPGRQRAERHCQLNPPRYALRVSGASARVGELLCSPIVLPARKWPGGKTRPRSAKLKMPSRRGTGNRHSGREQLSSSHPTTHLDALGQAAIAKLTVPPRFPIRTAI
jgi:hypothetical protein